MTTSCDFLWKSKFLLLISYSFVFEVSVNTRIQTIIEKSFIILLEGGFCPLKTSHFFLIVDILARQEGVTFTQSSLSNREKMKFQELARVVRKWILKIGILVWKVEAEREFKSLKIIVINEFFRFWLYGFRHTL